MSDRLGEALAERLESVPQHELLDVDIFLEREVAREVLAESATASATDASPVARLKSAAAASQADLLAGLSARAAGAEALSLDDGVSVPPVADVHSRWINNSVAARVTKSVLLELAQRDDVGFVELTRYATLEELLDGQPSGVDGNRPPPAAAPTWSVAKINAPLLWAQGLDGEGVVAAVIDTGVHYGHPDLASHMWDGGAAFPHHGWDFDDGDNDPRDQHGHGTACAGIVAGDGSAGSATGVAPGARVMAIRVGGAERNFWDGLEFALDHGAQVISMSMSWKYPSSPDYPGWRRSCESVLAAGVLHANSIGNQGDRLGTFPIPYNIATPGNAPPPWLHPEQPDPGGLASPISCGATDSLDRLAAYSGRGPAAWEVGPYHDYPWGNGSRPGLLKPDVCAPGPGTTSCNWQHGQGPAGPYRSFGGTSAATPHVGGCLCLLAQAAVRSGNPIVPARMQEALEGTAVRVQGQTRAKENHYGSGRVDVFAAFRYGRTRGWWS